MVRFFSLTSFGPVGGILCSFFLIEFDSHKNHIQPYKFYAPRIAMRTAVFMARWMSFFFWPCPDIDFRDMGFIFSHSMPQTTNNPTSA